MCSDILINKDGVVCGRTMDFCESLDSELRVFPRGGNMYVITKNGAIPYGASFGFVGITVLGLDMVVDGMNEMGFSAAILTMEGTDYHDMNDSLSIVGICSWLLAQCHDVNTAIEMLSKVTIWGQVIPLLNRKMEFHIVLHDIDGETCVCEIIDKKWHFNNNPLGVTTNGPDLSSQLRLFRYNCQGQTEWSSVTRFNKLANMKRKCKPNSPGDLGLVIMINHMLSSVSVPYGISSSEHNGVKLYSHTQWVLIKDLTEKLIYYRCYNDQTLRRVDLYKLDFTGKTKYKPTSIDVVRPCFLNVDPAEY